GVVLEGQIPSYTMPSVKNAAGYYADDDMDLVDLFIGSEGTLGIVSEVELELIRVPSCVWGLMAFFESEGKAVAFVRKVREAAPPHPDSHSVARLAAVEFFSGGALRLLRDAITTNAAFASIPSPDLRHQTAIYLEIHGNDEDCVGDLMMTASEAMVECGGKEEDTWMASESHEIQRLKDFRHAVPEAVNLVIDQRRKAEPKLVKLGTDMSVPDDHLERVLSLYNSQLIEANLEYVIFGHIGNNHLHVNILPRSLEEYEKGRELYLNWAHEIVELGGSISAEHGVGKLKTNLLKTMYGANGIEEMRSVKSVFDPHNRLNPGNLFERI
ncbi:MAG TPA: FAD-linked oxidase C-terminal domain-containing protein, partial [bacterium]|nr:FAD-linked oxidase C-terminal domain-containing protein [bacterium]